MVGGFGYLFVTKTRNIESFFNYSKNKRGACYQGKIVKAYNYKDFSETEIFGSNGFAFSCEFQAGNDIGKRGVFDKINDFIAATVKSPAYCLGNDNPENGLKIG